MLITPDWIGSPNFSPFRGVRKGRTITQNHTVQAIVDHIASGTAAGMDAWFLSPHSQVSAHYGVMQDGAIHQYVQESDTAWGAGILNHSDESLPWLPPLDDPQRGFHVNQIIINIEHEGMSGEAFPPPQLAATIALHRDLVKRYNLPIDSYHIIGHYRLDSVNRANCPGTGFPWDELFGALKETEVKSNLTEVVARITDALNGLWKESEALAGAGQTEQAVRLQLLVVEIKRALGLQ